MGQAFGNETIDLSRSIITGNVYKNTNLNMVRGTHASSYNEEKLAIVDGSMPVNIGWELVDGLEKVSSNHDQQLQ